MLQKSPEAPLVAQGPPVARCCAKAGQKGCSHPRVPQQPGGKARLGAERPANTPMFTLAWRHSPGSRQWARGQRELAPHGCMRLLHFVTLTKALGEWDARAGSQRIPADGAQHPHTQELPGRSRVVLKPGAQRAVVFAQVSRGLVRREG